MNTGKRMRVESPESRQKSRQKARQEEGEEEAARQEAEQEPRQGGAQGERRRWREKLPRHVRRFGIGKKYVRLSVFSRIAEADPATVSSDSEHQEPTPYDWDDQSKCAAAEEVPEAMGAETAITVATVASSDGDAYTSMRPTTCNSVLSHDGLASGTARRMGVSKTTTESNLHQVLHNASTVRGLRAPIPQIAMASSTRQGLGNNGPHFVMQWRSGMVANVPKSVAARCGVEAAGGPRADDIAMEPSVFRAEIANIRYGRDSNRSSGKPLASAPWIDDASYGLWGPTTVARDGGAVGNAEDAGSARAVGNVGDARIVRAVGNVGDARIVRAAGNVGDDRSARAAGNVGDARSVRAAGNVRDARNIGDAGNVGDAGDVGRVGDRGLRAGDDANRSDGASLVWVGNVPDWMDSADLLEVFAKCGTVEGPISIRCTPRGRCAFVRYASRDEAVRAIRDITGTIPEPDRQRADRSMHQRCGVQIGGSHSQMSTTAGPNDAQSRARAVGVPRVPLIVRDFRPRNQIKVAKYSVTLDIARWVVASARFLTEARRSLSSGFKLEWVGDGVRATGSPIDIRIVGNLLANIAIAKYPASSSDDLATVAETASVVAAYAMVSVDASCSIVTIATWADVAPHMIANILAPLMHAETPSGNVAGTSCT